MVNATFAAISNLRTCANMVANVAFPMFASGLLWIKHMFAASLHCANFKHFRLLGRNGFHVKAKS